MGNITENSKEDEGLLLDLIKKNKNLNLTNITKEFLQKKDIDVKQLTHLEYMKQYCKVRWRLLKMEESGILSTISLKKNNKSHWGERIFNVSYQRMNSLA